MSKTKIVHLLDEGETEGMCNLHYICNYAVYPTFGKYTSVESQVTCKKCKQVIKGRK